MNTRPTAGVRGPVVLALVALLTLTGCAELDFNFPKFGRKADTDSGTPADTSVRLVERDVEAPEIFQVTDMALWDGRPSLGGVWVAYPGNTQPERVIIRNEDNGKFVIGALFKRERENPGPAIQLSSDAAAAIGVLAGAPTKLNVTALKREEIPVADETPAVSGVDSGDIDEQPLDPIEAAAAAIDAADADDGATTGTTVATTSSLEKPFVQIGIFSVEENATNTSANLRKQGVVPIVKAQEMRGKKFWRVIVGPAQTKGERNAILKKVKAIGFADAYFVTN